MFQSRTRLAAENLFLRNQLACYLERNVRPHRTDNASRIMLVMLSRWVEWRPLLTIVRPDRFVRWHRETFRLFWRWKSRRRGRPPIPTELQQLIADMAATNRAWAEERIAAELRVRLGSHLAAAYGLPLHAASATSPRPGLRLLCGRDRHLSARLRVRDSGHRDSGSCTGTSPYIPQLNGRFNSFETASLLTAPIACSCTIAIGSSRPPSTRRCVRCRCAC